MPATKGLIHRVQEVLGQPYPLAVGVAAAAFLLYWRTTAPSVLPGDSGEFQFAAWGLWLAHPTGYPLYLILGALVQHLLPFGDPAYRLNLFSAVCAAFAVGISALVFWKISRSRGPALIAACAFAVCPLLWAQATRAEVYALQILLVVSLTYLGLMWRATPAPRYAYAFALVFGLALAHHRTTVLLLPAFAALFAEPFYQARQNLPRFLKRALLYSLVASVPLLLYAYIPLRVAATPFASINLAPAPPIVVFENSPRGWLGVILGTGFSGELSLDATTISALRAIPEQLVTQFNLLGVVLMLVGLAALFWKRQYAAACFMVFGVLTFALFNSVYHIGDIADYYTALYFFACIALAAGIQFLITALQAYPRTRGGTLPAIVLLGCFTLIPLENLGANAAQANQNRQNDTRARWETLLASKISQTAILLSNDRDEMTPLYYLQLVEHERPDLVGVFPRIAPGPAYDNVISLVQRVAPSGRPIYALKPIPVLTLRYGVEQNVNGLWQVDPGPLPPPQHPSTAVLGERLRVQGFSVEDEAPQPGDTITLSVQYEPLQILDRDYKFSVQLFDAKGNKVAQGNDHVPGDREYPPTRWHPHETVRDRFEVALDDALPAGEYRIMQSAYDPASGDTLGDVTEIGVLEIR